MAEVHCLMVEDGSSVLMEIPTDSSVGDLKQAIMAKKQFPYPTIDLTLCLAKNAGGSWLTEVDRATFMSKGEIPDTFGFPDKDARVDGDIHVLVASPLDTNVRSRSIDNGATIEWLTKFRATQVSPDALPAVEDLPGCIGSDLPIKIGIRPALLSRWNARITAANPQLLTKIFRAEGSNPCTDLLDMVLFRVVHPATLGTTKNCFISFWDDNIRSLLDFMFLSGESGRDLTSRVSERARRPSYHFILNSVCVFRGEEETAGFNMESQRNELCKNLVWSHGDLPYVFGYAAVGTRVSLYALEYDDDDEADAIELDSFYLDRLDERFRMLLALLHLCRLFPSIADVCPTSGRDEFRNMRLNNGDLIRLSLTHVEKDFHNKTRFQAVSRHLEHVYELLRAHEVPNVDDFVDVSKSNASIRLEPRGSQVKPTNLSDLFRALECVLEALVALHQISWMHRDIRWPNVLKRRDDSNSWFLIDSVDSVASPQPCLRSNGQLSEEEHAPEMFREDFEHTTAVEIWSVGLLIETSAAFDSWNDLGARTQFVELLLDDDPSKRPNAEEALLTLKELEPECMKQKSHERSEGYDMTTKRQRTH